MFTLEPEAAAGAGAAARSPHTAVADLAKCRVFRAWMEERPGEVNSGLARYETIKTFHLQSEPFSVEGSELTPTLKLKRRVITEKYGAEIEALYPG